MPKAHLTDRFLRSLKADRDTEYWDDVVEHLILRVRPSGRKTWFVRYYYGGTPGRRGRYRRAKIGQYPPLSLSKARDKAKALLGNVAEGGDPAGWRERAANTWTFTRLASEYLQRHAKPKKSSWREDRRILKKDLLPAFGALPAESIRKRDVIALLDAIVDRGAPVMANRTRALLSRIYTFGLSRDVVEHNPVLGTEPPGEEKRRDRVLTDDEIKTLWHGLGSEHPVIASGFQLLLLTGQRSKSVRTMESSHIDGEWWTIPRELFKARKPHRVFLSTQARGVIAETQERNGHEGLLLPSPRNGGGVLSATAFSHAARRIYPLLKMESFTPHDLRRTMTSRLTEAGVSRFVVERVLGHTDGSVTGRYDLYAYDKEKQEALTLWGEQVEKIIGHRAGP
jgi:integrase